MYKLYACHIDIGGNVKHLIKSIFLLNWFYSKKILWIYVTFQNTQSSCLRFLLFCFSSHNSSMVFHLASTRTLVFNLHVISMYLLTIFRWCNKFAFLWIHILSFTSYPHFFFLFWKFVVDATYLPFLQSMFLHLYHNLSPFVSVESL